MSNSKKRCLELTFDQTKLLYNILREHHAIYLFLAEHSNDDSYLSESDKVMVLIDLVRDFFYVKILDSCALNDDDSNDDD